MPWSDLAPLSLLFLLLASSTTAVLWNKDNCNAEGSNHAVAGTVTDAICCNVTTTGSECDGLSQADCLGKNRCHWYVDAPEQIGKWGSNGWEYTPNNMGGKCKLNRDVKNNVCCHEDVNEVCGALLQGKCPKKFQLSHNCCPGESGFKYTGILEVENDTMTCCNTPCSSLDEAYAANKTECTIEIQEKPHCAPGDRGYMRFFQPIMGGRGMPGMMGGLAGMGAGIGAGMGAAMGGPGGGMFNAGALQALLGFGGGSGGRKMGNVVQGFGNQGLPGTLGMAALKEAGEGQSKEAHVDEITVDDLMLSLIDALDTDKDVFDYEKEVTSDPWFRKQSHGGVKNSFSFIDPWMFLDQIYGSPFGMSNAQMTYGKMYGIPQSSFSSPKFGGIGGQGGRGGMGGMGMRGPQGMMGAGMGQQGMRDSRGASPFIPGRGIAGMGMSGGGMGSHGMMGRPQMGMGGMMGRPQMGMGGMMGSHGVMQGPHGVPQGPPGSSHESWFSNLLNPGPQPGMGMRAPSAGGYGSYQGGMRGGPGGMGRYGPQGKHQGIGGQNSQAQGFSPQQGLPPQQGGFPPQQGGFPPQQGGFPPQQGGFPPQQGAPGQQGGYPPQQTAPGHQGGFPPQQGGFPPQQGAPGQHGGFPPQQTAPGQQGGFSPQQGAPSPSTEVLERSTQSQGSSQNGAADTPAP